MGEGLAGLQDVWRPALALVLGFPVALLILNETEAAFARRGHPLAAQLRWIRNWILPLLALVLFMTTVLGWPTTDVSVRLAQTALWIVLAAGALGCVNALVFEAAVPGSWQTRVPRLLRDLVRVLLVALAAAMVYSQVWGEDLSGALTALGVGSVVLGLALQEPLGNLFSGVMLLMERPFEVGDDIEVGSFSGVVQEINWRSAHVRSFGGITRVIPNSTLNKETITNYSRPRRMRMEIVEIGFSYDDPPNKVRDALLEVARETPGVIADPAPIAATFAFADSGITYRIIYRTLESDRWPVRNELMTRIWYAAKRHGLTIPYPVRVNLEYRQQQRFGKTDPSATDWLARFPQIPPLAVDADAAGDAGGMLQSVDYARQEVIFETGDALDGVHVLVRGAVSLRVGAGGAAAEIAVVRPGEFFGEAGLHGTQPADVRAVALEDSTCVRISPDAARKLFEQSPKLARDIGRALDVRRRAALAARSAGRDVPS